MNVVFLSFSTETSKVDYVLFQAATAIMEAVVREWILLEKNSIESLRTFLLTYVLQRPKYVCEWTWNFDNIWLYLWITSETHLWFSLYSAWLSKSVRLFPDLWIV